MKKDTHVRPMFPVHGYEHVYTCKFCGSIFPYNDTSEHSPCRLCGASGFWYKKLVAKWIEPKWSIFNPRSWDKKGYWEFSNKDNGG